MPRNSAGVYSKPAGTTAAPNTTIESAKFNSVIDDIASDLNTVRPITVTGAGATIYRQTRAILYADLDHDADTPALVYGDSDKSYRGAYVKVGASGTGSWSQVVTYLPGYQDATAEATSVGGTANAITATISGYPDPDEAKFLIIEPIATNTSTSVTLALNGGGAIAVRSASGDALAIGDLTAGIGTMLFKAGSVWRQLVSSRGADTLDYQGEWDNSTTYTLGQFVTRNNLFAYLDAPSSTNDDPASGAPWVVVIDFTSIPPRYSVETVSDVVALDTDDVKAVVVASGGVWKWVSSDLSATLAPETVASSAVDSGTETITSTAHGLLTGHTVFSGSTVNGVTADTLYYVIRVDADNFKLAATWANALAGTAFNLAGTSAMTVKRYIDPLEMVAAVPSALARDGSQGAWVRQDWYLGGYIYPEWASNVDTDATEAFFHALNFADDIRLSARDYRITSKVSRRNKGDLAITGVHSSVSRFLCEGAGGFLDIIEDTNATTDRSGKQRVSLKGFSAYTDAAGGGTGIYFKGDPNSEPSVDINDVLLRGLSDASDYWTIGVQLINAVGITTENLFMAGIEGDANSMSFGLVVENTASVGVYQQYHENLFIKWAEKGVAISCTGTIGVEGITFDGPKMIGVQEGIYFDASGATGGYVPPYVAINSGEFDVDGSTGGKWAVALINVAQVFVDKSVFYGDATADNNALVIFENCSDVSVDSCFFVDFAGTSTKSGLWFKGTTTRGKVDKTHFDNLATGIIVDATASNIWVDQSCTFASVTTKKSDSGSKLLRSIHDGGTASVTSGGTVSFNETFTRAPNVTACHWGTDTAINVTIWNVTTTGFDAYHNGGGSVGIQWVAFGT